MPTPPDPDDDGRERLIGYLLRRGQHAWQRALDETLHPLGISAAGFGVLRLIDTSPASSGAALAAGTLYSPQATHQLLVSLEAAGLVRRTPDPSDARRLLAQLTPRGREVLAEAYRRASELEERMTAGLSAAEHVRFREWLIQAADALSAPSRRNRSSSRS